MPAIPEHEATGREELAGSRCSRTFLEWGKAPDRLWESRLILKMPACSPSAPYRSRRLAREPESGPTSGLLFERGARTSAHLRSRPDAFLSLTAGRSRRLIAWPV